MFLVLCRYPFLQSVTTKFSPIDRQIDRNVLSLWAKRIEEMKMRKTRINLKEAWETECGHTLSKNHAKAQF